MNRSLSPKRKKVFVDALTAGIELAIVRNNLEGAEIPDPSEIKRMAHDAVNALQGIDTCDPKPCAEWNALVDELECCFSKVTRPHEPKAKSQKPKAEVHA